MKANYQLGEMVETRNTGIDITDPTRRPTLGIINAIVIRDSGISYMLNNTGGEEITEDQIIQAYRPIPNKAAKTRKPRQAKVSTVKTAVTEAVAS